MLDKPKTYVTESMNIIAQLWTTNTSIASID